MWIKAFADCQGENERVIEDPNTVLLFRNNAGRVCRLPCIDYTGRSLLIVSCRTCEKAQLFLETYASTLETVTQWLAL